MTETEDVILEGKYSFEDAVNLSIEIVHNSKDKEEMINKLSRILDAYRERGFYEMLKSLREDLGIWKIP